MKTIFFITLACLSYSLKAQNNDVRQDTTQVPETVTIRLDGPKLKINPPLYILDGKEITEKEVQQLNPDYISSITVLKNADRTAPYGEKGKNGVVIIERKKSRFKLE